MTDRQIAHDALDHLEMAKRQLQHLETVLFIAQGIAAEIPRLESLLNLGWFYAADAANVGSCNAEEIAQQLMHPGPRNADVANRGARLTGADLGQRILAAREHASLGQDELAKLVGLEQTSISQLETGRTKRTSYLAEIARACGVEVNWLAFGQEAAE